MAAAHLQTEGTVFSSQHLQIILYSCVLKIGQRWKEIILIWSKGQAEARLFIFFIILAISHRTFEIELFTGRGKRTQPWWPIEQTIFVLWAVAFQHFKIHLRKTSKSSDLFLFFIPVGQRHLNAYVYAAICWQIFSVRFLYPQILWLFIHQRSIKTTKKIKC